MERGIKTPSVSDFLDLAVGWHAAGDTERALGFLDRAVAALDLSPEDIAAQLKAKGHASLGSPMDYWRIASLQGQWGRLDRAEATIAQMYARLGPLAQQGQLEAAEVIAWHRVGDKERAFKTLARLPQAAQDNILLNEFVLTGFAEHSEAVIESVSRIRNAVTALIAYRSIRSKSPEILARACSDGRDHFIDGANGFDSPFQSPDALAGLALHCLSIPEKVLSILDARKHRPDIYPPAQVDVATDQGIRARALARLGRLDEAVAVIQEIARPKTGVSQATPVDGGRAFLTQGGFTSSAQERLARDIQDVLEVVADREGADAARVLAARLRVPSNAKELVQPLIRRLLHDGQYDEALNHLHMIHEVSAFHNLDLLKIAEAFLVAGRDSQAREVANVTWLSALDRQKLQSVRVNALLALARLQARSGAVDAAASSLQTAVRVAQEKGNGDYMVPIRVREAQAELGDFEGAWSDAWGKHDGVRERLVKLEARAGHVSTALVRALAASSDYDRANAILAVVEGLSSPAL